MVLPKRSVFLGPGLAWGLILFFFPAFPPQSGHPPPSLTRVAFLPRAHFLQTPWRLFPLIYFGPIGLVRHVFSRDSSPVFPLEGAVPIFFFSFASRGLLLIIFPPSLWAQAFFRMSLLIYPAVFCTSVNPVPISFCPCMFSPRFAVGNLGFQELPLDRSTIFCPPVFCSPPVSCGRSIDFSFVLASSSFQPSTALFHTASFYNMGCVQPQIPPPFSWSLELSWYATGFSWMISEVCTHLFGFSKFNLAMISLDSFGDFARPKVPNPVANPILLFRAPSLLV